jgi:hypothetical protein
MTLSELAALPYTRRSDSAPDWLLGCFRRRSITFYTGSTDATTQVFWLQSRGLSADLRIAPDRPSPRRRASLDCYSSAELEMLAEVEGGVASTAWDGEIMRWSGWTAFQVHEKWPEPAQLRRVGDRMIEFAPSGAYVEDWSLQPSRPGPVIGLRLLQESNVDTGAVNHCGGGLVVCGDHAALVRGRPRTLPSCRRLTELIRTWVDDEAIRDDIFAFEASYAVRDDALGPFTISVSTNPLRDGETLPISDGFEYNPETQLVIQHVREGSALLERRFTIDTLEPSVTFSRETTASVDVKEWLEREAATLFASVEPGNDRH